MGRPLDGYPTSFGSSRACVLGIAGPASYTAITPGTAPAVATGGQSISASSFGMKFFDYAIAGMSDSAVYRVECIPGARSGLGPKGATTTYRLRWVVVATGAEAGAIDLSAEIVRVFAIGPK